MRTATHQKDTWGHLFSIIGKAAAVHFQSLEETRRKSSIDWKLRLVRLVSVLYIVMAGLLASPVPVRADVTNGLAAWWKFDEGAGTTAGDASGNANNGTVAGGASWTTGWTNGALSFNSGYVAVPNSPSLNASTAITIAAWARTTGNSNPGRLLQKSTLNDDDQYSLLLGSEFSVNLAGVTGGSLTNSSTPTLNVWHHIAATYDGSVIALYVDGVVVTQRAANGTINLPGATTYLNIGVRPSGQSQYYYSGILDDVRIYGRGLSSSEIGSLAGIAPPSVTGTVWYSGSITGVIQVIAATNAASWSTNISATITNANGGGYGYDITNIASGIYYVRAFRDRNNNGQLDALEPAGSYTGNPVSVFTRVTGVDVTLLDGEVYSIAGTVSSAGSIQTGMIRMAATSAVTNYTTTLAAPGAFIFSNVLGGVTYTLSAYRDVNANGTNDAGEAGGMFAGTVVATGDVSDVSIVLYDPDSDGDGLPDWWEILYGMNPDSPVGDSDGSDGSLVIVAGQTTSVDSVKSAVVGANPAGTNVLTVSSASGFLIDDTVLIIGMQDTNENASLSVAGRFEFKRIAALGANSITLQSPLSNAFTVLSTEKIQVLRVPEYATLTVSGTLSCAAWDGTVGGVLAFKAQNLFVPTNGVITASGKGYRGGGGVPSQGNFGFGIAGERTRGVSIARESSVSSRPEGGGGAGMGADGSGAGGGYATSGGDGAKNYSGSDYGRGATSFGTATLERITAGGGGGGSGSHGSGRIGVGGGAGGGVVICNVGNLDGPGLIAATGASGSNGVYAFDADSGAGGGGGAGGSVFVKASRITNALFRISAIGGAGGLHDPSGAGGNGGTGGLGRIRVDLGASNAVMPACNPPAGYTGAYTVAAMSDAVGDQDDDGLSNLQELQNGTNPTNKDSDADGLPDGWEVTNGTGPTVADADLDTDADGLLNVWEYWLGTMANSADSDGDLASDFSELQTYGTSPRISDSDGDSMPDGWEVLHGLNPLLNDATNDRDLDGLTNWEEYNIWLSQPSTNRWQRADRADSLGDGKSDYERVNGSKPIQYTYDKIDRLTGAAYNHGSDGFSIAYVYDGNGNLVRQKYLGRDKNKNGIPDLWEFQNGLSLSSSNAFGDTDGDGWSEFQEWRAGSSPTNSSVTPDILGVAGTNVAAFSSSFAVSNFVMAAGQLDGQGADELVIGADGDPGNGTNTLLIMTQTSTGWTNQVLRFPRVGITSIAIGRPSTSVSPAIYLGTRQADGTGQIVQVTWSVGSWQTNSLPSGATGTAAYVLGIRSGGDLVVQLSQSNRPDQTLFSLLISSNGWGVTVLDTNASHRGLGTVASMNSSGTVTSLRLIDGGGIQTVGSAISATNGVRIAETPATNRLLWRGSSVSHGYPGRTNGVSIFSEFVDDKNTNGTVDAGDDFVLTEFLVNGTNVQANTSVRTPLTGSLLAPSYALACVNLTNGNAEVFFTGEPDGRVYSWTVTNTSNALQRQLFDAHNAGKAWHQFVALRTLEPGEGLAGLRVDPTNPNVCDVIFWQPQPSLWTPAQVAQTAPATRILVGTNEGFGVTRLDVRIWDAEGNPSSPTVQYSPSGTNGWTNATLLTLDGMTYNMLLAVAAQPTGVTHRILWNSGQDLTNGFVGTVYLRARSADMLDTGEWSPVIPFSMAVRADSDLDGLADTWEMQYARDPLDSNGVHGASADVDGDGASNLDEYIADTNPTNSASILRLTAVLLEFDGMRVYWQGGNLATQYLEFAQSPGDTNWIRIFTNTPYTASITNRLDAGATNASGIYRIKAAR